MCKRLSIVFSLYAVWGLRVLDMLFVLIKAITVLSYLLAYLLT